QVRSPLSLSVDVQKKHRTVTVTGVLGGIVVRECVRCLKEYPDPVQLPFSAEYRREGEAGSEHPNLVGNGLEDLGEAEEEPYTYVGDQVELVDMLREQMILVAPMQPLCHPRCLGLCPVCGQNRNLRACGCQEPGIPSPFSVLRHKADRMKRGGR
ncbi:MAG: YceD family protein, partial [Nitrospirales bacterium]